VTWSSAPEAAKTDVSEVCHSIEVIGALCHEKSATGVAFLSVSHFSTKWNGDILLEHSQIPDLESTLITTT
jgi:hypothetical protein